jgi:hypothetical protein
VLSRTEGPAEERRRGRSGRVCSLAAPEEARSRVAKLNHRQDRR